MAQAVSVAGHPDVSPTHKPIDIRPDSTGSGGEGGAADDGPKFFEIRGRITEVNSRGIVVETAKIIIGDEVEVDFDLLKVGAVVRVRVTRAADGLVHAAGLDVLRPAVNSEQPPEIGEIVKRFAGGLDETDGPVARLGDNIVIVFSIPLDTCAVQVSLPRSGVLCLDSGMALGRELLTREPKFVFRRLGRQA